MASFFVIGKYWSLVILQIAIVISYNLFLVSRFFFELRVTIVKFIVHGSRFAVCTVLSLEYHHHIGIIFCTDI